MEKLRIKPIPHDKENIPAALPDFSINTKPILLLATSSNTAIISAQSSGIASSALSVFTSVVGILTKILLTPIVMVNLFLFQEIMVCEWS